MLLPKEERLAIIESSEYLEVDPSSGDDDDNPKNVQVSDQVNQKNFERRATILHHGRVTSLTQILPMTYEVQTSLNDEVEMVEDKISSK